MQKLAIDFGSVYTNIYMLGGGLVLSEPTVAAVSQDGKNEVKAVGDEAKKLIGKTAKNTKIIFPVFEGEIVNDKVAAGLLSAFLRKIDIKSGVSGCQALFSVHRALQAIGQGRYQEFCLLPQRKTSNCPLHLALL